MPWYPGPDGRYINSFWDGRRWVAVLTDEFLMLKGRWFSLDRLTHVSYTANYMNISDYHFHYERMYRSFAVRGADCGSVEWSCNSRYREFDSVREDLWIGLVDICRNVIEPRLHRRIFAVVQRGGEFTVGETAKVAARLRTALRLRADGFTVHGPRGIDYYNWSDLYCVRLEPYHSNGASGVAVWARRPFEPEPRIIFECSSSEENAVLLEGLLPMCAAAFGGPRR